MRRRRNAEGKRAVGGRRALRSGIFYNVSHCQKHGVFTGRYVSNGEAPYLNAVFEETQLSAEAIVAKMAKDR